nr:hypothetical protein 10 [bacterium]
MSFIDTIGGVLQDGYDFAKGEFSKMIDYEHELTLEQMRNESESYKTQATNNGAVIDPFNNSNSYGPSASSSNDTNKLLLGFGLIALAIFALK